MASLNIKGSYGIQYKYYSMFTSNYSLYVLYPSNIYQNNTIAPDWLYSTSVIQ